MASPSQSVSPPPLGRQSVGARVNRFWQRVTDGLELDQLWDQFRIEARTSYSVYSREIDSTPKAGVRRGRRWLDIAKQFFWAILDKLSPARRVLLLAALVMMVFYPEVSWTSKGGNHAVGIDLRLWGGLIMF